MATNEQSSTPKTQSKRLARAKIKHPVEADGSSKSGSKAAGASKSTKARVAAKDAKSLEANLAEERKAKLKKIAIGAFAVIMAIAMMVPSCAGIVSASRNNAQPAPETTTDEATSDTTETSNTEASTDATEEEAADDVNSATNVAAVDKSYAAELASLEEKLAADDKNLAALLNLGKLYMSWGYSASMYASSDEDQAHVTELFDTAIDYYDRYLKLHDSNAVKVDKALCQLYGGDTEAATASLKKLTTDMPDYGPAWANLGMVYEMQYQMDDAKAAYEKAIEVDAEDEEGAKSFASRRLAVINSGEIETDATADITENETEKTPGLSDTLADASGTSY